MIRRLDPRTIGGSALVAAGIVSITAALLSAGPARARAAAAGDPPVWLSIELAASAGRDLPLGGTVTVTAAITNSSTTTVGTDVSGTTTTATIDMPGHPTVSLSLATTAVSFVSGGGGGYTCAALSGQPTCSKTASSGTLAPGGTDSATVVVSVVGSAGDPANATATVHGNDGETPDVAGASATATYHAFVGNSGAYTNNAPAGCFVRKVGGDQEVTNQPILAAAAVQPGVANGAQVFPFRDGTVIIIVTVPPGALPNGTILSLYAGDPTCWNAKVSSASSSHTERNAYAVGWALTGNTSFTASSSIEISVSDTGVHSGDPLFGTNPSGLGSRIGTASSGNWTATFTDDPGFVLAQAAAAVPATSSSASATTTITAPPSGGGPVSRGTSPVPLALGVLALVGGAGLVGTRRRRRPE